MIKYEIANLKSLSNNTICSLPYPEEEIKKWAKGDISLLLKSNAPQFIKDILTHKKRADIERSKTSRFFGEAYVCSIFSNQLQNGWYSSFHWLYAPHWITGKIPKDKEFPIMTKLKKEFYTNALEEYINSNVLKELQASWSAKRPEAPDLWLIDKKGRHYFIEVKKESDKPDKQNKQLLGLALLEKYFNVSTYIIYIYSEGQNTQSIIEKKKKWLADYYSVRKLCS